jgi:hypothetical protein
MNDKEPWMATMVKPFSNRIHEEASDSEDYPYGSEFNETQRPNETRRSHDVTKEPVLSPYKV